MNTSPWTITPELKEIMEADSEMIRELVSMFLSDSVARLQSLNGACVQRDFKTIRAQAHSLKGSSLQMGAARLAGLCAELEHSEKPEPEKCKPMTSAIVDEFARVRLAMEEFLADDKTAVPAGVSRS